MLSRVADSLYWLGRYIERAENLSRMVDVTRREALESFDQEDHMAAWRPLIYATCLDQSDEKGDFSQVDIAHLLTLDQNNPGSIISCIASARENARTARDQISEQIWVDLNRMHLFLKSEKAAVMFEEQPEQLYQRVINFSVSQQGLTESTILHDEGWHFMRLGRFLERADKTSRVLDTLTFDEERPTNRALMAVLKSCSGFTAFRAEYFNNVSLRNVSSFLFFSTYFPRSIRFCLREIEETLLQISGSPRGTFSNDAERLTGKFLSQLNFTDIEEITSHGLHETIDELQTNINDIGQGIFEEYVLLPLEIRDVVRTEGFHANMQQQQQNYQHFAKGA